VLRDLARRGGRHSESDELPTSPLFPSSLLSKSGILVNHVRLCHTNLCSMYAHLGSVAELFLISTASMSFPSDDKAMCALSHGLRTRQICRAMHIRETTLIKEGLYLDQGPDSSEVRWPRLHCRAFIQPIPSIRHTSFRGR